MLLITDELCCCTQLEARWGDVRPVGLLVEEAGGFGPLLTVVEGDAVVAAVPEPHPVHIEPPAVGVVLVDLGAAHLQLQPWRQHAVHLLLQPVITPASGNHQTNVCSPRQFNPFRENTHLTGENLTLYMRRNLQHRYSSSLVMHFLRRVSFASILIEQLP